MTTKLDNYLRNHASVPGWLNDYSARVIVALSRIQTQRGVTGCVGEIGVHMGRLFILLKLLASDDEKAIAIDVFSDQHLNMDQSGRGDRQRFLANLERYASGDGVVALQASSLDVRADDILARVGPCRLFSIDGGHTAECTLNDLRLAERVLAPGGIVILDDYFNPSWPDVAAGASAHFLDRATELRPFAIAPNKLFLVRLEDHSAYLGALRRSQRDFHDKDSRMFGCDVAVFGIDPASHAPARAIKRWLRDSPLGPSLVGARRRLRMAGGR